LVAKGDGTAKPVRDDDQILNACRTGKGEMLQGVYEVAEAVLPQLSEQRGALVRPAGEMDLRGRMKDRANRNNILLSSGK